MGEDLPDRLLCPVRALRYYLKLKHKDQDPNNRFRRLLCAFKLGHTGDISKQTVSGWIRQLIKQAYSEVQDEDIPHLTHTNFQARELRAFASSLAFHQNYSLKQVMEAASWRNNNMFVSFYLRDLSQMGDVSLDILSFSTETTSGNTCVLHLNQCLEFCSDLMATVCKPLKIKHSKTSPYHPQSDGPVNVLIAP